MARRRRSIALPQPEDAAQRLSTILTILAGIATVLAVLGSFTVYVWTTSRNLASVTYVDTSFQAALAHSNKAAADFLAQANRHADENREATMREVKEINAANREHMAKVTTTLENVVDTLKEFRQDQMTSRPKSRDR